jgi:DNA helicase-4
LKVAPGFLGSLFCGSHARELELGVKSLTFRRAGQAVSRIPLEAISKVTVDAGRIWSQLSVVTSGETIKLGGVGKERASQFGVALLHAVSQAMLDAINKLEGELDRVASGLRDLLTAPRYLANRDIETWQSSIADTDRALLARILPISLNALLPREGIKPRIQACLTLLTDIMSGARNHVERRNKKFVTDELARWKEFFDGVEKSPLTAEQRVASVVFEDRNLLVAAAGSGKTSTIVGKIGYALLAKQYAPSDILVLAFNNDAAAELSERLNATLASQLGNERIKAKTFHAFGLEILATTDGIKPSVANSAEGKGPADNMFAVRLVRHCLRQDAAFGIDWVMFRTLCFKPARNPAEFDSLDEWDAFVRTNGEYRNGKRGFLTIQGEIVKSQGELAIANWLYMNGVEYEYERPYEYATADREHRQYRPDFFFPAIGTYLEHYALDSNGHPPAAFGQKYLESMKWKAKLHADKATALITTTFSDFIAGELFPKLEKELRSRGQVFAPRPVAAVLKDLSKSLKANIGAFLRTAMKHAKSNALDEDTLQSRAESHPEPFRARLFVRILWKLMLAYESSLRESAEIDFEDMIIRATREVERSRYRHGYKLILIDEFQDISQARAKLVKALLTQAPDCKLFVVGDDWQSIYRFAGSDIDVFTRFASHFGVTATNYLTRTFRSNQCIADVAAAFVQKNSSQIEKRVEAQDPTSEGTIIVRGYTTLEDMSRSCEKCLGEIANWVQPGKRHSVFLVARYNLQKPPSLKEWQKQFPMLDISFRTAHSSKGLEADYVIVLGLHTGSYAFPSEISDDPLLHLVMPQAESYPNAEERRLFYVAITRARRCVYLLGSRRSPSVFLTEIAEDHRASRKVRFAAIDDNAHFETCPRCGHGRLIAHEGKYGEFWGCSNYPKCKYIRDIGKMY